MAFTPTEMGHDLSQSEEETRRQAFQDVRTRAFFKQGFEAGTELASEEVLYTWSSCSIICCPLSYLCLLPRGPKQ